MKTSILAAVIFLFMAGCATLEQCPPCPREDVVIAAKFPWGISPVIVPKGKIDAKDGAMPVQEFFDRIRAQKWKIVIIEPETIEQ
jgi:hypothetical protein